MNFILNKEKGKSTFLVVLFLITILLLYFLWGGHLATKKFDTHKDIVLKTNEEQIKKFFKPFRVRLNFGGDNYTVLYEGFEDIWDEFINSYYQTDQHIQSIDEEQYNERLESQSVEFDFGYDIPFDDFKKVLDLFDIPGDTNIETITKVAYSNATRRSHFLYDGKNDRYYRIISDQEHIKILDEVANLEKRNNDKYTPINRVFGDNYGGNNNILMPYLKNNMLNVSCQREIQFYQSDRINGLAKNFFGESFDFVRKIVETNGTVIYMYGYGQKKLTVSNTGYLEYKEELDVKNHEDVDYIEALSIATSYVKKQHGNWQTLKGTEIYPYLKSVQEVKNSKQIGYRFKFGYKINGYPVCYEKKEALEIEVIGKQVVYYKRFILNQKDTVQYIEAEDDESNKKIISTDKVLTNNYEALKAVYIENGYDFKDKSYEKILAIIIENLKRVDISYYLVNDDIQNVDEINLIPSWIFMTDKFKMYFNIQTGRYLGWSSLE